MTTIKIKLTESQLRFFESENVDTESKEELEYFVNSLIKRYIKENKVD